MAATQRPYADLRVFLGYGCTAAVHGEEAFEKQSGRRDLNPRPLDPQILARAHAPQRTARSVTGVGPATEPFRTLRRFRRGQDGCPAGVVSVRSGSVQPGCGRLDRLGRSLRHLVETVNALADRGVAFASLHEGIDTTTSTGRLVFHIFAALAEFERELIAERAAVGRAAARARGRQGGLPPNSPRSRPGWPGPGTKPRTSRWPRLPRRLASAAAPSTGRSSRRPDLQAALRGVVLAEPVVSAILSVRGTGNLLIRGDSP